MRGQRGVNLFCLDQGAEGRVYGSADSGKVSSYRHPDSKSTSRRSVRLSGRGLIVYPSRIGIGLYGGPVLPPDRSIRADRQKGLLWCYQWESLINPSRILHGSNCCRSSDPLPCPRTDGGLSSNRIADSRPKRKTGREGCSQRCARSHRCPRTKNRRRDSRKIGRASCRERV